MRLALPPLYVILDADCLQGSAVDCMQRLADAGVRLFQFRDKKSGAGAVLREARVLAEFATKRNLMFFVNDRPDIALLAGAHGVHVGQEDLGVEQARAIAGPGKWVGVSTHNLSQLQAAAATSADYIAVGPVFPTGSKANPDPVVGLEFVKQARKLTDKPLVAIGGMTLERASEVMAAGADSVAVISDILRANDPVQRTSEFLERLQGKRNTSQVS